MISTRDLSTLPDIDDLRRLMQSLAMLDAILCTEWQYRYYSFDSAWNAGEQMGSMRDGCGDDYFVHFTSAGCWIKGFAHESAMSPFRVNPPQVWPGVLDRVPKEFASSLLEPAFKVNEVTFCIWRRYCDPAWLMGPVDFPADKHDPDGSAELFSLLDCQPMSYQAWATSYYERDVVLAAVEQVYQHQPMTKELVASLNPDVSLNQLDAVVREIGYPF